jgi:hypothetical protein
MDILARSVAVVFNGHVRLNNFYFNLYPWDFIY